SLQNGSLYKCQNDPCEAAAAAIKPEQLLKGHLAVDHDKDVHRSVFQSKPITSKTPQRKFIRETSSDGDINCFGPLCTESVQSNKVDNWYDVCGFKETKSAVGRNPQFVNVNRTVVFGSSQLVESSESSIMQNRKCSAELVLILFDLNI
uniref:Uncharacterized protein n=1 Tax=Aegilops tauschii subsp. strangulata TaxID=200361 RepID=A0A452YET5_AEGTS